MKKRTREWLKKARKEAGLTIRELAQLSGFSQPSIEKVLSGERAGSVEFWESIENVIDNHTKTLRLKNRDGSYTEIPYSSENSAAFKMLATAKKHGKGIEAVEEYVWTMGDFWQEIIDTQIDISNSDEKRLSDINVLNILEDVATDMMRVEMLEKYFDKYLSKHLSKFNA